MCSLKLLFYYCGTVLGFIVLMELVCPLEVKCWMNIRHLKDICAYALYTKPVSETGFQEVMFCV